MIKNIKRFLLIKIKIREIKSIIKFNKLKINNWVQLNYLFNFNNNQNFTDDEMKTIFKKVIK